MIWRDHTQCVTFVCVYMPHTALSEKIRTTEVEILELVADLGDECRQHGQLLGVATVHPTGFLVLLNGGTPFILLVGEHREVLVDLLERCGKGDRRKACVSSSRPERPDPIPVQVVKE